MTKYAVVLVSVLALAGCQSYRSERDSQSENGAGNYGASPASKGTPQTGAPSDYGVAPMQSGSQTPGDSGTTPGATESANPAPANPAPAIAGQNGANTTPTSGQTGATSAGEISANQSATRPADQIPEPAAAGQNTQGSTRGYGQVSPGQANQATPNGTEQSSPADLAQPGLGTPGQSASSTGTGAQSSYTASATDRILIESVTNSLVIAGIPAQTMQNIHVRAMNGRVVLTGRVNSPTEKQQIEKQVKQTPGVQSVNDLLRVQSVPGATGAPAEQSPGQPAADSLENSGTSPAAPTGAPGEAAPPPKQ